MDANSHKKMIFSYDNSSEQRPAAACDVSSAAFNKVLLIQLYLILQ